MFSGENEIWTSDPRIEINRDRNRDILENPIRPTTIGMVLRDNAYKYRDNVAFRYVVNNKNIVKTWGTFYNDILRFAKSLIYYGLE